MNQFDPIQPIAGLGQGVVIAVALDARRGLDADLGQSLAVADGFFSFRARLTASRDFERVQSELRKMSRGVQKQGGEDRIAQVKEIHAKRGREAGWGTVDALSSGPPHGMPPGAGGGAYRP